MLIILPAIATKCVIYSGFGAFMNSGVRTENANLASSVPEPH